MTSSSYNQYVALEVEGEYPYPSHVCAPNFVTLKLSGIEKYGMWKTQMLCLLESHGMYGFIDGTLVSPPTSISGKEKVGEHQTRYRLWRRSDALVKGWILGSLSEPILCYVLNSLAESLHYQERDADNFSAKDVWDELHTIYAPAAIQQTQTIYGPPHSSQQQTIYGPAHHSQQQTIYGPPHLVLPQPQTVYGPPPTHPSHLVLPQWQTHVYDPPYSSHPVPPYLVANLDEQEREKVHQELYGHILAGHWDSVDYMLTTGKATVIDKITNNGNTTLHVAVGATNKRQVLEKLLGLTPPNTRLFDVRNSDGSTILHVAGIVGNTEAASILVAMPTNRELLFAKDIKGHTPLAMALSNMHKETSKILLDQINTDIEKDFLFSGTSGDELLVTVISSKDFRLAHDMVGRYSNRALHTDTVMMGIAQNFPSELNILEEYIGFYVEERILKIQKRVERFLQPAFDYAHRCVPICGSWVQPILMLFFMVILEVIMLIPTFPKILVWPFIKKRVRVHQDASGLLTEVCHVIRDTNDPSSHQQYYTKPIFEATRQNSYEVVEYIVRFFPNAISTSNEHGHNIIQYAVISHSEKVYNLLYQMSEHKNLYRTMRDSYGNNLLHLAARLAPAEKLNMISGAALRIQRELQWFKEVEGFVCPLNITQKNYFNETPQMVFTREHKELVIEGEKWMKATANSYTITAALITTIVFAASITLPGGNIQDTGIPIFTKSTAFRVFAISDAISLFASVTSLLMFLSILTARFAEQDFLIKLPTKLIIGLATLFISTTAMIVAFGATLYLVFGQGNSRILITIVVFTCLPIICFVGLQFPLVVDVARSTYGRSIFGKQRDRPFY